MEPKFVMVRLGDCGHLLAGGDPIVLGCLSGVRIDEVT